MPMFVLWRCEYLSFVLFPSLLFPASNRLVNNCLISLQQWMLQLVSKQMISIHNAKGQTWALMLISLILFIGSTNLLGLLPHSFTPTMQLSINLVMAFPLWAGAVITGFHNKTKASLAHFLPQGTPTPLIPILIIVETISLFIQACMHAFQFHIYLCLVLKFIGNWVLHLRKEGKEGKKGKRRREERR